MKRTVLVAVAVAGLVLGNPVMEVILSEFQVAPDSLERIEFHAYTGTMGFPFDLEGWQIITSAGTAYVDAGVVLETESSYVVVDRTNTTGVFSLPDGAGEIALADPWGNRFEWVTYPGDAGANTMEAWIPPEGMSCAMEYWSYGVWPDYVDCFDWYLDATPTFGLPNDDLGGHIEGHVYAPGPVPLPAAVVIASSPYGYESDWTRYHAEEGQYEIHPGFGTFQITVVKNGYLPGAYPDSVTVAVNQVQAGIDILLYPVGIEDVPGRNHGLSAAWRGGRLAVEAPVPVSAEVVLADMSGRVRHRERVRLEPGANEMDIPGLARGAYVCLVQAGGLNLPLKFVIP